VRCGIARQKWTSRRCTPASAEIHSQHVCEPSYSITSVIPVPFDREISATPHAEAFRALESEPPDGLVVSNWTSNWIRRQSNFDFALHRWVPVTHPWREYVDAGGLMSYGVNLPNQYRRTADYVDKIIKGASPAELPIQLPSKFESCHQPQERHGNWSRNTCSRARASRRGDRVSRFTTRWASAQSH
jgi:hypothetical protein